MTSSYCPICKLENVGFVPWPGGTKEKRYQCPRCGDFVLADEEAGWLQPELEKGPMLRAVLSHAIRRMQRRDQAAVLDRPILVRLLENSLPSMIEQRDALILLVGQKAPVPGELALFDGLMAQASIGAASIKGVGLITGELHRQGLLDVEWSPSGDSKFKAKLTFAGWKCYEDLQRGATTSLTAFMALEFGDPFLDRLVATIFKPAVKMTGFDLVRADDIPKAGLIDDHIRVMIRTAHFMIADLTHDNPGAYWEAGFAEGLGKPVIYTCEVGKFKAQQTHFDTSHQHTVTWDAGAPDAAAEALKATVRATLPDQALLTDPQISNKESGIKP